MPLLSNAEIGQMIEEIKKVDGLDPKKWAVVIQPLDKTVEANQAAYVFDRKMNQLHHTFQYPRCSLAKCLVESKQHGWTEEEMLIKYGHRMDELMHVVILFGKDTEKTKEEAELLEDFMSDIEDVEILVYPL